MEVQEETLKLERKKEGLQNFKGNETHLIQNK
jgi:hypothetical protein